MKRIYAPWRMSFIIDAVKGKKNRVASECILCELPGRDSPRENLVLKNAQKTYIVLNKYPYNSGHLMVVPKGHTSSMEDLSKEGLLEVQELIRDAVTALKKVYEPQGFNVGMNLGEAGGAGIPDHLHYHIVPRWSGDTNFMPLFGETKVLPETLEETYDRLVKHF